MKALALDSCHACVCVCFACTQHSMLASDNSRYAHCTCVTPPVRDHSKAARKRMATRSKMFKTCPQARRCGSMKICTPKWQSNSRKHGSNLCANASLRRRRLREPEHRSTERQTKSGKLGESKVVFLVNFAIFQD